MSSNSPTQPNKPGPPSQHNFGEQPPWTAPPANAPSGGGAIIVIVLVLGLVGLLGLGCVGIGAGLFWLRSETIEREMVEAQLDADMRELEQLEANQALENEARAKADAEFQKSIDDFEATVAADGQWTYERSPEGLSGVVQEMHGGIWIETRGDGVVFRFTEKARGPEFVELFDESRQLQVRLYDDRMEWRRDNLDWVRGQSGEWKSKAKQP
jgi:hypothetical protein